ncbi:hypothetical protein [Roseateles albus]|uniref:HTH marR-type domain-containing protein n=1 Tax=Roseateles albus TaxID=2987525 RepID=A0ABT5KGE5_9BURK|nr:hypothetical protein [Roseateles albus]MDC8773008.1 hypothetical protein [Roseateles albus]
MNAPHHDRTALTETHKTGPVDLPLALAMLALHRDLIGQVQRMTWELTAGDFEALVIWCELARYSDADAGGTPRTLLLHDLVTATAIPRETVRRKLERLAALGHVERVERGWVTRMAPLDQAVRARAEQAAHLARDSMDAILAAKPAGPSDTAQVHC